MPDIRSTRCRMRLGLAALLLALAGPASAAAPPPGPDGRIDLGLTTEEQVQFLSEMRQMLASIQGIMEGIGSGDRDRIAEAARRSGNQMARATPDAVRAKMPPEFRDIGGPTHMLFEELVIRAETDEPEMLAAQTGELMKQCLACHAAYRVH